MKLENTLKNYEYDAIDYLYDIEPQQDNLFYVSAYSLQDETSQKSFGSEAVKIDENLLSFFNNGISLSNLDYSTTVKGEFLVKNIKANLPSIEYEENKALRMSFIKGLKYNHSISISFIEDPYKHVLRYHLDWIAQWYDRANDVLKVGPRLKIRNLTITTFHYVSNSVGETQPVKIYDLSLCGLKVAAVGDAIELSSDNDNSEKTRDVTYDVNKATINFYNSSGTSSSGIEYNII